MPEDRLDTLRALAEATRGAESEEDLQRALMVLAERSGDLASELAELDRLHERALELERLARQRADEADEARTRFLDNVSHELRTPLNGIIGYLDLLSEGIGGTLTEAQERQIQRIRAGAVRLKEMIEEILTFSRIEAGGEVLDVAETDVGAAVADVAALVGPLMTEKALAFDVALPPDPLVIRTDGGKLRQILLNLLSNAQKYTERGHVQLTVEDDGAAAVVIVRDTGPGIAARDRERIFHPFQRLFTADQRGGTGLGLSVSRSLATLLGGDLTVESEPGSGSTFVVRIPKAPSPEAVAMPGAESALGADRSPESGGDPPEDQPFPPSVRA